jgi:hypothetical protein
VTRSLFARLVVPLTVFLDELDAGWRQLRPLDLQLDPERVNTMAEVLRAF